MSKVKVQTLVTDDAAVAEVKVDVAGYTAVSTASSKRHPSDTPNSRVGERYAVARALRKAAEQLEADTDQIVDKGQAATYPVEGNTSLFVDGTDFSKYISSYYNTYYPTYSGRPATTITGRYA